MRTALRICPEGRCRLATRSSVCVVRTNARRGCPERNYIGTIQRLRRWMGGRSSIDRLCLLGSTASGLSSQRCRVPLFVAPPLLDPIGGPRPPHTRRRKLFQELYEEQLSYKYREGRPACSVNDQPPPRRGARHDGVVWKRRDGVRALDQSEHHGDGSDEWEDATETEPARRHPDTGPLCGIYELHEQQYREPLIGPKVRGRHEECQSNASTTTDGEGGGERPSEAQVATGDAYAYPAFVGMLSERRPDLGRRRPRLSPSLRTTLNHLDVLRAEPATWWLSRALAPG
jgi:hypothetical protein